MQDILDVDEIILGEKVNNVDYYERKAVYGIVINNEIKIATIKTPKGYFLPGGGIENDENNQQCLEREFMEETGYEIKVGEYIGNASLYHISKSNRHVYGIGFFYFVDLIERKNNGIEDDHTLIWLEPNECIDKLNLGHQSWAARRAMKIKGIIKDTVKDR